MLQAIREKAQGWIAWAIVILISIPFALWGIQEYLGVGAEPEVALVDGEPITERMLNQRVRDFRENLRSSLGDSYRADLFEEKVLKEQVRSAMIEEMVLVKHASDWNLRTSDAQARGFIASIPAFQRDGRFDQLSYETAVRNRGTTRAGFELSVRQDLAVDQLRSGIRDTAFVTTTALADRVRLVNERRELAYARIASNEFAGDVAVDQGDLRRFYEDNLERYRTPERVRLDYLLLDATGLARFVEVDDAALRGYFDAHRAEFVAREERAMRHILVGAPANADEAAVAAAQAKAEELLAELRGGADFAALAREHSDDPGSADAGGDLGWVERGLMVAPFEDAAFTLAEGELSKVVRTDFGFHIIQVTDIRGGSGAGFEDMRDQVDAAFRKFEAENLYFDYAERLAESAYENPATLVPAAEALGLTVQQTGWLTRDGTLPGPLGTPKVVNAAFAEDVLVEGNNSDLIETGPQQAVVVRVAEHEPAGVKDFQANLAEIERDYIAAEAAAAAVRTGEEMLAALQGGAALQELAADRGWVFNAPVKVGRDSIEIPPEVITTAFAVQPPAAGETRHVGVAAADGDYLLIAVSKIDYGDIDGLADPERGALREQAERQAAAAQLGYLVDSLRAQTDIELKPIGE